MAKPFKLISLVGVPTEKFVQGRFSISLVGVPTEKFVQGRLFISLVGVPTEQYVQGRLSISLVGVPTERYVQGRLSISLVGVPTEQYVQGRLSISLVGVPTRESGTNQVGLYHDCDEYIIELAKLLLGHEPVATGITPLQLTNENYGRVRRFYIECTEDRAVTPFIQQKMYTEMPCEKVYTMATGHSPFFSQPGS